MKTWIRWMILATLICAAAGPATSPATKPATLPTTLPAGPRADKVAAAEAAVASAVTAARERVNKDPAYKAATAEAAKREAQLKQARAGSDPQAKLDASSAYNKARTAAQRIRDAALANDEGLNAAKQELAKAKADAKREADERAAEAKRKTESDPVWKAKHDVIHPGMTEEEFFKEIQGMTSAKPVRGVSYAFGPKGESIPRTYLDYDMGFADLHVAMVAGRIDMVRYEWK